MVEEGTCELKAFFFQIQPKWTKVIKEEVIQKSELQTLVKRIQDEKAVGPWAYREGVIFFFFLNCIYLLPTYLLIPSIIQEFHLSVHKGLHKTLHRVKQNFYWKGIKRGVKEMIKECEVCQTHKAKYKHLVGPLSLLPIFQHVWIDIFMYFVEGLPNSKGKTTIFVVVDQLSKFAHFIPINHLYTTVNIAHIFF